MHPIPTRILFLLLFFSSLVAAANFTQCLEDFRKNVPSTIGGVDSRGNPTSPAQALGLTYETCTALCGLESESFKWRGFAQIFSSWLLPWLAFTSQLPFGSGDYIDDFFSVAMSVGSPALAAYSLVLTSLNARSVYRRAKRIKHDSKTAVARALITLQQIPLELTKDKRLLAFITINDQWRQEIVDRLNRRTAWPIVIGPPVLWVLVAFTFTVVDSFVSLNDPTTRGFDGHALGTLWLWLLCLVIGWWWVPTFTCSELKSAIGHANERAATKAAKRLRQMATKAHNTAKIKISRFPKRMPILKRLNKPLVDLPEAPEANENRGVGGGSIQEVDIEPVGQIEPKSGPLPGPICYRSTVSSQLTTESQQGHGHLSVNANPTANQSAVSFSRSAAVYSIPVQSEIIPERDRLLVPTDSSGSLNRDEFRLAAMFNYSRVMRYLILVDDVLRAVDKLTREKDGKRRPVFEAAATQPVEDAVFPPGALISMFIASIFALILQCGTTAAATIIRFYTPTVGVGCRALGYIIYGGIAVLILFLTIISTIFVRISETRHEESTTVKNLTAFIAITLRRITLLLALINATGLILLSCFQFSRLFDNCYCNASVVGRGTDSYVLASYEGWVPAMRNARIVATVLATASTAIYMIFLWFMSALPAEIDYL